MPGAGSLRNQLCSQAGRSVANAELNDSASERVLSAAEGVSLASSRELIANFIIAEVALGRKLRRSNNEDPK